VAVVRVGDSDQVIYRVHEGKLVHASAPWASSELRQTVCGPALVGKNVVHVLDLATLKDPPRHPCRSALANTLRAAVDADKVVRDAERALDALAPDRFYKSPATPRPGPIPTCSRAGKDERAWVLPLLEALPAPAGGRRPAPGKLRVTDEDFGCKHPKTGAYLVRMVGLAEVRLDAVAAVSGHQVKLAAGWQADPFEIFTFIEVDLDGDGGVESVIMRGFKDYQKSGWLILRSDGSELAPVPELARVPRLRPLTDARGNGLLADGRILRFDGTKLSPTDADFAQARAALAGIAAAKAALETHKEEMFQALWAETPPEGRAAWEKGIRARFEQLGGWTPRIEKLLAEAR
jgi:hypothetical protein